MVVARTLSGFKDRLPNEALIKHDTIEKLSKTFKNFGFAPIETPHLEYAEILVKQGSDEIQKELYRFNDHGDRDVALRFDQTVPLARFVSQYRNELGMPFKRYAIGNVFRGERAQKGRYREFTQCDFDFIGTYSIGSDAEIIQVIVESLYALGIDDFTIALNNRKIMNGFAASLGIADKIEDILRIVDKITKIGEEQVSQELEEIGIAQESVAKLIDFISKNGSGVDFFEEIAPYKACDALTKTGIEELESIYEILDLLDIDPKHYKIDFSIARGLGYYTGVVYETTLNRIPSIGSVCSGGRYDNLTQNFSKELMPGVGASIGLDRLIAALEEIDGVSSRQTPAKVLIANLDSNLLKECYRIGEKLRALGVAVEVYPEGAKLKKQFSYANKKGHRYVMPIGEDELQKEIYSLKDMESGNQESFDSLQKLSDSLL